MKTTGDTRGLHCALGGQGQGCLQILYPPPSSHLSAVFILITLIYFTFISIDKINVGLEFLTAWDMTCFGRYISHFMNVFVWSAEEV